MTFGTGNTAAQNLILTGAGNWLFNNNIVNGTAAISITQSGAGVTTLAGNNGYTGATTVAQGTLSLTGSLAATAISVASGATFSENSGGLIGGAASLTTSGLATLAGNNGYTGATTVAQGTLNLTGSVGSTSISVASGATFSEGNAGLIGGAASLITSGLTTLAGSNTFTGVTSIPSGGTLTLANVGALSGSTFDASGAGLLNFGALTSATFGGLQGSAAKRSRSMQGATAGQRAEWRNKGRKELR